ncbi:MAG: hypothetical protein FJ030_02090 [Chloroflexi bacterium]|nr:hypothetical protein [Chloroflexota bacterium]
MRIISTDPAQLHLEGRIVTQRGWLAWGFLFLPGMIALLLLPEANRFIGLIVWMAIWLALAFVLPRWLGQLVRVTIDSKARAIVWTRDGQITRTVPFADVKRLEVASLSIAARPYKTFQLAAVLHSGGQITLAVSPSETEIKNALQLARQRLR